MHKHKNTDTSIMTTMCPYIRCYLQIIKVVTLAISVLQMKLRPRIVYIILNKNGITLCIYFNIF